MYKYYEVKAIAPNQLNPECKEALFGSYVKGDCIYELECDRKAWKEEGYTSFKINYRMVEDAPDPTVYTIDELEEIRGDVD